MPYKLIVEVVEGRALAAVKSGGTSDPYCKIEVHTVSGTQTKRTKTKRKNLNPSWNEKFEFDVDPSLSTFSVFLLDDRFTSDTRMGTVKVYIEKLFENGVDRWFPLEKEKSKDLVSGEIRLRIIMRNPNNPIPQQNNQTPKPSSNPSSPISSQKEPDSEIIKMIKEEDWKNVQKLINNSVGNVGILNNVDKNGDTPLHLICSMLSHSICEKILISLLKLDGIDVSIKNLAGEYAFHHFCKMFYSPVDTLEVVTLFLKRGMDINIENEQKENALFYSMENKVIRVLLIELLIERKVEVNKINKKGETPLHQAVRLGREEVVSILLKGGADINLQSPLLGVSPKMLAQQLGVTEVIETFEQLEKLQGWLKARNLDSKLLEFLHKNLTYNNLGSTTEHFLKNEIGLDFKSRTSVISDIRKLYPPESFENTTTVTELSRCLEKLGLKAEGKEDGEYRLTHEDIEFTKKLGSGTSGEVFKGLYKGQVVALKVLKEITQEQAEFKKEIKVMSTIRSPYLVYFFGILEEPNLCMCMEMCSRGSLYHVLSEGPPDDISWDLAFHLAIDAVTGVKVLHDANVFHRDLKSLNLLVTDDWHVKVCDFGLSRFDNQENLATMYKMRGTMAFCAPEIYFGKRFTPQADVYSMGMVLWELVCRVINQVYSAPYSEFPELRFDFQIIIKVAKQGVRPSIPESAPPALSGLIKQCLLEDFSQRPDTKLLLASLKKLQNDYRENREDWDKRILPKPQDD